MYLIVSCLDGQATCVEELTPTHMEEGRAGVVNIIKHEGKFEMCDFSGDLVEWVDVPT